jgi:tetratricopeptide (TPR) repeat protein
LPTNWQSLAAAETALGSSLDELDEPEQAEQSLLLASKVTEAAVGPMHPLSALALNNVAEPLIEEGRYEDALTYTARTMGIAAATHLPEREIVNALMSTSDALSLLGRFAEAHAAIDEAIAIARGSGAPQQQLADAYGQEGAIEELEGRYADAAAHLKLALKMMDHADSVVPACALGLVYLGQGQLRLAIPQLEDALSLVASRTFCLAGNYALAQALWATGSDRPRARALVRGERAYFRAHPGRSRDVRDRDQWFRTHAPELTDDP